MFLIVNKHTNPIIKRKFVFIIPPTTRDVKKSHFCPESCMARVRSVYHISGDSKRDSEADDSGTHDVIMKEEKCFTQLAVIAWNCKISKRPGASRGNINTCGKIHKFCTFLIEAFCLPPEKIPFADQKGKVKYGMNNK